MLVARCRRKSQRGRHLPNPAPCSSLSNTQRWPVPSSDSFTGGHTGTCPPAGRGSDGQRPTCGDTPTRAPEIGRSDFPPRVRSARSVVSEQPQAVYAATTGDRAGNYSRRWRQGRSDDRFPACAAGGRCTALPRHAHREKACEASRDTRLYESVTASRLVRSRPLGVGVVNRYGSSDDT